MGFLWDWNEIWPFPVMWSLLIFHFAGIECITFTASSFSIWNSSTGIPSPPLALFVMMLPKDNLTSHSRMSGCLALGQWSHHHGYLGHWDILFIVLLCSCHLLVSSASFQSIPFLSFILAIFAWNIPLVSLIFLKISLVLPILLFSSICLHRPLRKAFLSLLAVLWDSAFRWVYLSSSALPLASLLLSAICKASLDNHFPFLHFFFLGDGLHHCLLYSITNLCL